jgi:hypothetical protein
MNKNLYLLAFMFGLAMVLTGASVLKRLALPLLPGGVGRVQAAGEPSPVSSAAGFSLDWYTIDDGGGQASGGTYQLSVTVGQPDAGTSIGSGFTLEGGFWPGTLQPWHTYLPALRK